MAVDARAGRAVVVNTLAATVITLDTRRLLDARTGDVVRQVATGPIPVDVTVAVDRGRGCRPGYASARTG